MKFGFKFSIALFDLLTPFLLSQVLYDNGPNKTGENTTDIFEKFIFDGNMNTQIRLQLSNASHKDDRNMDMAMQRF